ncbi:DUF995 domain-containing protein [Sinorhizobium saheli]|uniref:DUF995 domain-containing protein n=1 Tax=Sinorhizobium saheli TaxID=36856 RepID=A0A178YP77_SINSA|nr:DUF995 domain-containing protein [Sinorhizobium saheli]MQW86911.1 DUF995 domain-containing protein [Sinorhizobium saheli]OAP49284.1 hypothetical protein ATB98_24870 [Sinorhizobium saheli]
MKAIIRGLAFTIAVVAGIGAASTEAAAARKRATSTPLTQAELYALYGQKSWIWKKGAGYFSVRQRRFTAWSAENGSPSYGIGRWFIAGQGKLCFKADWHARDGSAPATTCFSHRKRGGVIYQKREPDGEWYVFRHAPTRADDEFMKLRRGNYVSARLSRIENRLGKVK